MMRDFEYVQGPEGQTVVIVPVEQKAHMDEDAHPDFIFGWRICAYLCVMGGTATVVVGFLLLFVLLWISDTIHEGHYVALTLIGFGVLSVLVAVPLCRYTKELHDIQLQRRMHIVEEDNDQRHSIVHREEEFFQEEVLNPVTYSRCFRIHNSRDSNVSFRDTAFENRRRETRLPISYEEVPAGDLRRHTSGRASPGRTSLRDRMEAYSSETGYSFYSYSHSDNALVSPRRMSPGRLSPGRLSPGRLSPRSTSPGRRSRRLISPYQSSPVGERSFSPVPDINYLNQFS